MYGITIDLQSGVSQYRQLYSQIRDKIVQGVISDSTKISSTRDLASSLNISRTIILEVIDQLKVEGYLETKKGSGTYVVPLKTYKEGYKLDQKVIEIRSDKSKNISLLAGFPELSKFPKRSWNKCYLQGVEYASVNELGYPNPIGNIKLREVLQSYLFKTKGIKAEVDQIIITTGSSQALALMAQLKRKIKVVLEDPIATFVPNIFRGYNCNIDYCKVDNKGLIPKSIPDKKVDLIYVSPSHQFPLGGTLPASRRMDLLNIATKNDSFIVEDDYDGEYRYSQRPIAPLQTLGPGRVIYLGTFSKILSPALRLGYMVIPKSLIEDITKLKRRWDNLTETFNQLAMARFIEEGYLERHIRKMSKLYKNRKIQVEEVIKSLFGEKCKIIGNTTGLHLIMELEGIIFDKDFYYKLKDRGLSIKSVNDYSENTKLHNNKVVIGYGHNDVETIRKGLLILKDFISN